MARFTDDELQRKVQEGFIVESEADMTETYKKALITQLTVQGDTELMSAPAYYMAEYDSWALSRFDDIWRATEQPEVFDTIHGTTAAQAISKVEPAVPSINQIDPPEHSHLRKAIRRAQLDALEEGSAQRSLNGR